MKRCEKGIRYAVFYSPLLVTFLAYFLIFFIYSFVSTASRFDFAQTYLFPLLFEMRTFESDIHLSVISSDSSSNLAKGIPLAVLFYSFSSLLFISILRTLMTSPGTIPRTNVCTLIL